MSRMPINLGDRRVAVAVLALLAVVVVVNLRSFGPSLLGRGAPTAADEEAMPLPQDLDEVTRSAAVLLGGGATTWSEAVDRSGDGASGRDPFQSPATKSESDRGTSRSATARRAAAPATALYTLNAILLGGDRPTAMINGYNRHPGDRVGPYRVESIAEEAVVLVRGHERLRLTPNDPIARGRK